MLDETTKRLVDEVARVAGSIGGGEQRKASHHEREIMALFDRTRGMFGAVRLLSAKFFRVTATDSKLGEPPMRFQPPGDKLDNALLSEQERQRLLNARAAWA